MNEIWKDIEGYEGSYQVSNLGNVKRIGHYSFHPRGKGHRFWLPERMLKQDLHNGPHPELLVTLSKEGICTSYQVHRLVASAFLPNPEHKPQVNHIDGDSCNNNLNNLEWVTGSENMQHAIRTGLYSADKSRQAGMTHAKPVKCIETGKIYRSQGEAARDNNVSLLVVQDSVKYHRPGRCGLTFEQISTGGE